MLRRRTHLVSVVVPAYNVAAYLGDCLDSVLSQDEALGRHDLEVIVVDDGSTDETGALADECAAGDARIRVVHTENRGLGAARNEGFRHVRGDLLAFADSDDIVAPSAYATMLRHLDKRGCDFVTGSVARLIGDRLEVPRWMARLHATRRDVYIDHDPEMLGDVFAWNKLFTTDFWRGNDLAWPEGVRYEDQPTTTRAYLQARRFGVSPEVVYHWRIRDDGSSITQQRSSLEDLRDRWATKQMALSSVEEYGAKAVTAMMVDKVLAGDLHRYFAEIPGCSDEWWDLLYDGVRSIWGERSLTHSGLLPADRLIGWLVEQGRREDAEAVAAHVAQRDAPLRRVETSHGRQLVVSVIDTQTVDPSALTLRDDER